MKNRYDSLKREAKSIQDENESLMTALKLLNNEINMNISRSKICMMRKPLGWQEVITGQCPETKRESVNYQLEERFYWHRASQTINNERTTVIVGDCIIKNVQGIKLAKTVGQRVVVKPFPEPQFATWVRMLFLQLIGSWSNLSTCGYQRSEIIYTERCGRC